MKVLFIRKTKLGAPGAAVTYFFPKYLKRLGHDVAIIAKEGGDSSLLRGLGVDVCEVSPNENWFNAVRKYVKKFNPDIVHVFIHAGCGIYPLICKGKSNKQKFVLDIRSPLLKTGVGRVISRLKNIFEPALYDVITSHGIESARTVIGNRAGVMWVPPGVDDELLINKNKRISTEIKRLIYIGSLDGKRKLKEMIRAVSIASKDVNLVFDIYGNGTGEAELEDEIIRQGMEHVIHLKGAVPRKKLFEIIPEYDLGLVYIPSGLYETAPPLKAIEYLANKVPVIATDTLGNRVFVEDKVNGLLVNETAECFALGIIDYFNDKTLKFSNDAYDQIMKYTWSNIVSNFLMPVYKKCVSK